MVAPAGRAASRSLDGDRWSARATAHAPRFWQSGDRTNDGPAKGQSGFRLAPRRAGLRNHTSGMTWDRQNNRWFEDVAPQKPSQCLPAAQSRRARDAAKIGFASDFLLDK